MPAGSLIALCHRPGCCTDARRLAPSGVAAAGQDKSLRQKAIEITKEAARWALALGAGEVTVWSAYDGYDYQHQVDYTVLWQRVVDAFQEVCDAFPTLRISLEFKPTDENTRFFAVPSTGAAMLLAHQVCEALAGAGWRQALGGEAMPVESLVPHLPSAAAASAAAAPAAASAAA